jgi:dihydropyrimidinase
MLIWWSGTRPRRRRSRSNQKVDFNVFEGTTVQGVAMHTLSRGALVWSDGDLRAQRGAGQYLKRPPNASYYDAIRIANRLKEPHPVER